MSTYCNGLAGIGIGLILLNEKDFIELEAEALNNFDAYLSKDHGIIHRARQLRFIAWCNRNSALLHQTKRHSNRDFP